MFWETIKNYIEKSFGLDKLDTPLGIITCVFMCINVLLVILMFYRSIYLIIGCFFKVKPYKEAPKDKKYAFIISARNEEKVIGNLIDSIKSQDYPAELIRIYLIADNCSPEDKTSAIAKEKGAIVYERHDLSMKRKGYALKLLFENIARDYGIESVDGYILMDADNIISHDFVSKMNDAFCNGKGDVYTGHIVSKNFTENFFAYAHSIDVMRSNLSEQAPRQILHTGTLTRGTGVLFKSSIFADGWKWLTIAEDKEFSIDFIDNGGKIEYVKDAVFFDEQPYSLKISLRQRLRWAKGGLILFAKYGHKIIWSFLKKPSWYKYDTYFTVLPSSLITFALGFIYNVTCLCLGLTGSPGYSLDSFLLYLANISLSIMAGGLLTAIIVAIKERKNIPCPWYKELVFLIIFGFYDLLFVPISFVALFTNVTWKHIDHKNKTSMKEMEDMLAKKNQK